MLESKQLTVFGDTEMEAESWPSSIFLQQILKQLEVRTDIEISLEFLLSSPWSFIYCI